MVKLSYCACFHVLVFYSNFHIFLCRNEKPLPKYNWFAKPVADALNGVHMRVSLYYQIPLLTGSRLPNGSYVAEPSFFSELIDNMAHHFKMTYEYRLVDVDKWFHLGNHKSLMWQLLNDETDIVPFPFPRTVEFSKQSFMGVSLYIMPYTFLQRFPLEESRITAPIRPFDNLIWGLFIFSTFAIVIFMTIVTLTKEPERRLKPSFSKTAYRTLQYVLTILLAQGNSSPGLNNLVLRVMVGLWLLMMVVMINAYTGTLTSFLTVPKYEPTIDTFEQLVASKKKLTTEKGAQIDSMLLNATSGIYKIIGDDLRKNPELLFSNYRILVRNIVNHDYIYCGPELITRALAGLGVIEEYGDGKCMLTLSKKPLQLSADGAIAMRKEWPYNNIVDQKYMQYLWESGLTPHLIQKYIPFIDKCNTKYQQGRKDSIKLDDFRSVFSVMIIGLVLSFLTFILEVVVHWTCS